VGERTCHRLVAVGSASRGPPNKRGGAARRLVLSRQAATRLLARAQNCIGQAPALPGGSKKRVGATGRVDGPAMGSESWAPSAESNGGKPSTFMTVSGNRGHTAAHPSAPRVTHNSSARDTTFIIGSPAAARRVFRRVADRVLTSYSSFATCQRAIRGQR
jgi:hypothetical protein